MYKSFLTLWPELKEHRRAIFTFMVLALVIGGLTSLIPYLLRELMDGVFQKTHLTSSEIKRAQLIFLSLPGTYLVLGLARYFHFYLVKIVSEKVTAQIRTRFIHRTLDYNLSFHMTTSRGSGGLLSKMFNDTNLLQQGLIYYADIFREPVIALGLLGFMFYTHWKLTLLCLISTPVFLFLIRKIARSLRKYGFRSQEAMDGLTVSAKEALSGVKVIQSFRLESWIKNQFQEKIDHYLRQKERIIQREELTSPINEFLAAVLFSAICFYQISLMEAGSGSSGQFFSFIFALGVLQNHVKKTQMAIAKLQQNVVTIQRIYEVLQGNWQVPVVAQPRAFPRDWSEIEYKNVSFAYGKKAVLSNVSFKIQRGQKLALVGESGSGKSSLTHLLSRFFDPHSGEISIGGIPIDQLDLGELRKNIALVSQDTFLFQDSIYNNIALANLQGNPKKIPSTCRAAHAWDFIQQTPRGLQSPVGEGGGRLSGGEKQRLSIARAMYKNSEILILDEATSALDSASELAVQRGLETLMEGKTVLIIAHRLSTIQAADKILVLKSGRIVEQGSHEKLLANRAEYFHFHQLQGS